MQEPEINRENNGRKKLKKESFMQGVLALMVSQVLIKVLGLVYNLYLTNKEGFGDTGNAIRSSGYQIYALLLTLSSIGVPNAISKLVSERVAVGDNKGAHRVFKIAFATFAVIGLIGTLALFFGAGYIAGVWFQIPEAKLTLVALSPSIFFVSIASVIRGYFNGRKNMKATANSQTIEQVFKTILTIGLVELIFTMSSGNTTLMAAGANLATTLAVFLSFMYLFSYYKIRRREMPIKNEIGVKTKREPVKKMIKRILSVSIPISLSSLMSAINKNVDSLTVVRGLKTFLPEAAAKAQYGILSGKVDTLTSLPLSFNIAFATALVPALSEARAKKDENTGVKRVSFSLLITMLIGLPCTIGMIIFAQPILNLLFPNAKDGAMILAVSALTVIFTVLAQTTNGALQGMGKVMVPATALGCGMLAKLILNLVLVPIPEIGAVGAAIGSVVCHMISFSIGFTVLRKNMKLDLPFGKFIVKPVIATIMMSVCSYFAYITLSGIIAEKMATIIALVIAIVIYLLSVIALGILSKEDIYMIPYGQKIYKFLEKIGIYKEKTKIAEKPYKSGKHSK